MVATAQSHCEVLEAGPLEVLPEEHLARGAGRALTLSTRELRLLTELARRPHRIVAREELFSLVWGREMRPGDRSVDVYVRKLRVKLRQTMPEWRFIHTHFGFGYRLSAEIAEIAGAAEARQSAQAQGPDNETPTSRSQLGNTVKLRSAETALTIN